MLTGGGKYLVWKEHDQKLLNAKFLWHKVNLVSEDAIFWSQPQIERV